MLADRIRNYYNIFDSISSEIMQIVGWINTVQILSKKETEIFQNKISKVYTSLDPDPHSLYFTLFFGLEWEKCKKIHMEMTHQLELHKQLGKGTILTFNWDYHSKNRDIRSRIHLTPEIIPTHMKVIKNPLGSTRGPGELGIPGDLDRPGRGSGQLPGQSY